MKANEILSKYPVQVDRYACEVAARTYVDVYLAQKDHETAIEAAYRQFKSLAVSALLTADDPRIEKVNDPTTAAELRLMCLDVSDREKTMLSRTFTPEVYEKIKKRDLARVRDAFTATLRALGAS
jgi:ribosomal protein L44E